MATRVLAAPLWGSGSFTCANTGPLWSARASALTHMCALTRTQELMVTRAVAHFKPVLVHAVHRCARENRAHVLTHGLTYNTSLQCDHRDTRITVDSAAMPCSHAHMQEHTWPCPCTLRGTARCHPCPCQRLRWRKT